MLGKKMLDELNKQLNREMYSAYLYMSMSAYSEHIGLRGFANWFMVQYKEEMEHAMRIYQYINEQGEQVKLMAIEEPPAVFESPLDMFEKTSAHEQFITKSINNLMDVAIEEKEHATKIFLQWFVTEQIEEESNDSDIINRLRLIGDSGNGLFMLDREMGTRVFVSQLTADSQA
jgi:ferritin